MEGSMDGAFDLYWQGTSEAASREQLTHINHALSLTLDPHTSNDARQQALEYLEQVKQHSDAPQHGFTLADDWEQNNAVRYYGLQLLEHSVRYYWSQYTGQQAGQVRQWVKCLAGSLRPREELFIVNKIAQLWVEVSKRCWGGDEWPDMDSLLGNLWNRPMEEKGTVNKILVLYILETLSEDIINNEDPVAALRLDILGNALNDIIVPADLYAEFDAARSDRVRLRSGDEGWLARICDFFSACVKHVRMGGGQELMQAMTTCAIKALQALRPTVAWVNLKAAVEVNAVDALFLPFHTDDIQLQMPAVEVLYSLLSRPYGQQWHTAWLTLLEKALHPDRLSLLRQCFDRLHISPGEDEGSYALQKKMSELLSILSNAIAHHPDDLFPAVDAPPAFVFFTTVLQSKSLLVSIPILHSWTKLMVTRDKAVADQVLRSLPVVLQTCSTRLFRYEAIVDSDDTNDEVLQFLNEDFDTIPERHAFLGNYRRYCVSVIEHTARFKALDALSHVLGQMRELLETGPYATDRGYDRAKHSKTSISTLQFDAQFQVVMSALKGYSKWLSDIAERSPDDEHGAIEEEKDAVAGFLRRWIGDVIRIQVDDPDAAAQVMQTVVGILRIIRPGAGFVLQVVEHLLTQRIQEDPSHAAFSDSVKAFDGLRVLELQKIAANFPNDLLEVYQNLEARINELEQQYKDEPRMLWSYKAVLFLIIHRATGIEDEARLMRLQQMMQPIYDAWGDDRLQWSLSNLHNFCDSLGLGDLEDFYKRYGFAQSPDWASQQLDEAGQAKQAEIRAKSDVFPLRMTKTMLAAMMEKVKNDSPEYAVASRLWESIIPVALPKLLQMLRHAQAFHNMANWSQLPEELQEVVKRTLQDRFWQSGISNESKDEFYARIVGSRTSYEGFASAVRGTPRHIRDQGYQLLFLLTAFEEQFYSMPDLAPSLADALYADADCLTANHLHPVVNLTTGLAQRCPPHYRREFLPPLLTQMFTKFDSKISTDWEAIVRAGDHEAKDEELSEEMRVESVLRHLTYSMVSFVSFLLEHEEPAGQGVNGHAPSRPTLNEVVLSDTRILEPLILFCTHALRMRDTRCCTAICRVFRTIIPKFRSSEEQAAQVREFICTEVLKACITSLNEPYFADMQKELAALIAQLIALYAPLTSTPGDVLLSLPKMSVAKVNKAIVKIVDAPNERQKRALVLDLLEGVRGVSIYDSGKIVQKKATKGKAAPSQQQQQYIEVEQRPGMGNGDDNVLEDVAGLFPDT